MVVLNESATVLMLFLTMYCVDFYLFIFVPYFNDNE